jgi:hypothetical protein
MDAKSSLVPARQAVPTSTRRRRAFHWVALAALGALALAYRHVFDAPAQTQASAAGGCRGALDEDPAHVWDKVDFCVHEVPHPELIST